MNNKLRIAMCQLNPTTGDFKGNFERAKKAIENTDADLFVFPECYVHNYPSDDLYFDPEYLIQTRDILLEYVKLTAEKGVGMLIGYFDGYHNRAMLVDSGEIIGFTEKRALPKYGVFDDTRWFSRGDHDILTFRDQRIDVLICEDLWENYGYTKYDEDYEAIFIVMNSSPYGIKKHELRQTIADSVVYSEENRQHTVVVYVNQVGGNDELVWDGGSFASDGTNRIRAPQWVEGVYVVEVERNGKSFSITNPYDLLVPRSFEEERYILATLALRDYINKVGFTDIVFGNSGGADSCLVALITADALGPEHCLHVRMPSSFTTDESNNLGRDLTEGIGATGVSISIADQYATTVRAMAEAGIQVSNLARENLQAQLRGDILSAISNTQRRMIISTGNKSEAAMGYATLYGDMRGGFNPLKDMYKHKDVYELLRWRVEQTHIQAFDEIMGRPMATLDGKAIAAIKGIIDRPPSAELAPGQKDTDSLPDYEVLDNILWHFIDGDEYYTVDEIAERTNHPREMVADIINRVRRAEFKRNQACPGPKIHRKSFTKKDWRFPIASKFKV